MHWQRKLPHSIIVDNWITYQKKAMKTIHKPLIVLLGSHRLDHVPLNCKPCGSNSLANCIIFWRGFCHFTYNKWIEHLIHMLYNSVVDSVYLRIFQPNKEHSTLSLKVWNSYSRKCWDLETRVLHLLQEKPNQITFLRHYIKSWKYYEQEREKYW